MAPTSSRPWPPPSTADRARSSVSERLPRLSTPCCDPVRLVLRRPIESGQHVGGAVDVEVVEHGVDPLDRGIDPGFDLAQEVDPVDGGAALVGQGEGGTGRGLEGAEHVAGDATPAVVDLLPGAL